MTPADSVGRLEMQNLGLTAALCLFLMSLGCGVLPESGGVGKPDETAFTTGTDFKEFQLCDSRRLLKMCKMSLNCSLCFMLVFGLEIHRIRTSMNVPDPCKCVCCFASRIASHKHDTLHKMKTVKLFFVFGNVCLKRVSLRRHILPKIKN